MTSFNRAQLFYILSAIYLFPHTTSSTDKTEEGKSSSETDRKEASSSHKGKWSFEDPALSRIIASQTAFTQPKNTFAFNATTFTERLQYQPLIYHFLDLKYGILNNFEIRLTTYLPIYWIGFGLISKFALELHEYIRIGWMAYGGIAKRYFVHESCIDEEEHVDFCKNQYLYGGAPLILTIGTKDHHANLSIHVINHKGYPAFCIYNVGGGSCDKYLHNMLYVSVIAGVSLRISKHFKLLFDFMYLFLHNLTSPAERSSEHWHSFTPMLGIKIIGKRFYGEIGMQVFSFGPRGKYGPDAEDGWNFNPIPYPYGSFGLVFPLFRSHKAASTSGKAK